MTALALLAAATACDREVEDVLVEGPLADPPLAVSLSSDLQVYAAAETALLLAPPEEDTTPWVGTLELLAPSGRLEVFEPRSVDSYDASPTDWWYVLDDGSEAKAFVDHDGGLLGYLAVVDGRIAIALDLDGDGIVDYYEDADARLDKRYVLNETGRALADAIREGRTPPVCAGDASIRPDSRATLVLDCAEVRQATGPGTARLAAITVADRSGMSLAQGWDDPIVVEIGRPFAHERACSSEAPPPRQTGLTPKEREELEDFRQDVHRFGHAAVFAGAYANTALPIKLPRMGDGWVAALWEKVGGKLLDEALEQHAVTSLYNRSLGDWGSLVLRDGRDLFEQMTMGFGGSSDRCGDRGPSGRDGPESASSEPRFHCGTVDECVPLRGSRIKGDPHLTTFDGLRVSFQAAGEFVYVDSPTFTVQTRFEGQPGTNTWTEATAVRVGDHVVEVFYDEVSTGTGADGVPIRLDGAETHLGPIESHLADGEVIAAATWTPRHQFVYVSTADGWFLVIENLNMSQNLIVVPPADSAALEIHGLAGSPDGDRGNDLRLRDGTTLEPQALRTVAGLYATYAADWRVRPDERLFTDTPAEQWLTATYTDLPDVVLSLGDLPSEDVAAAYEFCTAAEVPPGPDLDDCIFDVAVTGDEAWADQHATSEDERDRPRRRSDTPERKADDPLFVAAHRCADDDLAALLTQQIDVGIRREDDGWTALMFASQHDCPDTVRLLLAAGADPNQRQFQEPSLVPLYLAAQNGRVATVQVLLEAGADPQAALTAGDTPLLIAAFRSHPEVVALLLSVGADANVPRSDGVTPLMAAVQEGDRRTVALLLNASVDVQRATFTRLATALHFGATGDAAIVAELIAAGADLDRGDSRGDTPLHLAASRGNAEVVQTLLLAGADATIANDAGHTPADVAEESVAGQFR